MPNLIVPTLRLAPGFLSSTDGYSHRWLSLRTRALRSAGAGALGGEGLQLLDVREIRLPASHGAEGALQAARRRRRTHHLRVQYENGETPFLLGVRHQVVLRPALASRRLQRQRALPGPRHDRGDDGRAARRPQLGKELSRGSRHVRPVKLYVTPGSPYARMA